MNRKCVCNICSSKLCSVNRTIEEPDKTLENNSFRQVVSPD